MLTSGCRNWNSCRVIDRIFSLEPNVRLRQTIHHNLQISLVPNCGCTCDSSHCQLKVILVIQWVLIYLHWLQTAHFLCEVYNLQAFICMECLPCHDNSTLTFVKELPELCAHNSRWNPGIKLLEQFTQTHFLLIQLKLLGGTMLYHKAWGLCTNIFHVHQLVAIFSWLQLSLTHVCTGPFQRSCHNQEVNAYAQSADWFLTDEQLVEGLILQSLWHTQLTSNNWEKKYGVPCSGWTWINNLWKWNMHSIGTDFHDIAVSKQIEIIDNSWISPI